MEVSCILIVVVVTTHQTVRLSLYILLDINYTLSQRVNEQMPLPQPWQLRARRLGWGPEASVFPTSVTDSVDPQPRGHPQATLIALVSWPGRLSLWRSKVLTVSLFLNINLTGAKVWSWS